MAVRVTLAGHVGIDAGTGPVDAGGLGRLGRVAFAYLVNERRRPVPRGELADLLWGEDLPRSWETSLRVTVSRLRRWLAAAGLDGAVTLISAHGCYELRLPSDAVVDVEQAARDLQAATDALAAGDLPAARRAAEAAANTASRDFLPGTSGVWVEARQAAMRDLRVDALEVVADAALAQADQVAALTAAEEAVELDALRESAHLRVMRAHAAAGNRPAALRAYERCRRILVEELGISPSAQTEALYLSLLGDDDAPPAAAPATRPGTLPRLPVTVSSLVGRESERAEVESLVRSNRVVTLVGTGGIGKTRLALEVAAALSTQFPDGAAFLPLAEVIDPETVVDYALTAFGLRPEAQPDEPALAALAWALADRGLLLVVDNCEHVVAAAAALVDGLLRAAPALSVLATSREPLGVGGEIAWRVPALAPDAAARLFVERAAAARPGFAVEPAEEPALSAICRRLDGIPLALELAAARVSVLSVSEIAGRLDDRFRLLAGGPRTSPSRHQTLRAAIDWTYDALPATEQRLLRQLAVFGGYFSLDAARRVIEVDDEDPFELLARLVSHSLVLAELGTPGTPSRYRLLETIRAYAREKLEASDEDEVVEARLLAWAAALAEEAEEHLDGPDAASWLARLDAEQPNLRAALGVDLARTDALRLATALGRFWEIRGQYDEGRRWLRAVLAAAETAPPLLRARAANAAGLLAQHQGDYAAARSRYEESLAIRRRFGDELGVAAALHGLGNVAALEGDVAGARAVYEETLAIGRRLGELALVAAALANLGWVAHTTADFAAARAYYQEALAARERLGDAHGQALVLGHLGDLAYQESDYTAAAGFHRRSLEARERLGDRAGRADSLATLGHLALLEGDVERGRAQLEESLALRREIGDRASLPAALANLADLAMLTGDLAAARAHLDEAEAVAAAGPAGRQHPVRAHVLLHQARLARAEGRPDRAAGYYAEARRAVRQLRADALTAEWLEGVGATIAARGDARTGARLLGAADALRRAIGLPVPPPERPVYDRDLAAVRAALGETGFADAWAAGRSLPTDDAVAEATTALS